MSGFFLAMRRRSPPGEILPNFFFIIFDAVCCQFKQGGGERVLAFAGAPTGVSEEAWVHRPFCRQRAVKRLQGKQLLFLFPTHVAL